MPPNINEWKKNRPISKYARHLLTSDYNTKDYFQPSILSKRNLVPSLETLFTRYQANNSQAQTPQPLVDLVNPTVRICDQSKNDLNSSTKNEK